jgi:hypothetical protein
MMTLFLLFFERMRSLFCTRISEHFAATLLHL